MRPHRRDAFKEAAAARAMARLAGDFGVSPEELALGIIRVANSHMAKALSAVSLERGLDPRDFTLCCFGGAGGLHVCELALELNISRILIPAQAGVLSALGMARAGFRREFSRTLLWKGPQLTWQNLEKEYRRLQRAGWKEIQQDGRQGDLTAAGVLDLRYAGQSYTLKVPLSRNFLEEFRSRHVRLYGHAFADQEVEAVVLRVQFQGEATGSLPRLRPVAAAEVSLPPRGEVGLPQGRAAARLFYRPDLEPGAVLTGPALILDDYATVPALPGFQAQAQTQGHL